jgi:hypothetical protein
MTFAIDQYKAGLYRINEDMTNSNISDFISTAIDTLLPVKFGKTGHVAGPDFKEFLRTAQKMPNHTASGLIGNAKASGTNKEFYVDQLRKGLLAKGKPLNKMTIKQEDISLLKAFLVHLGVSKEKAEQIIKNLAEKHPGGAIPLSQFIHHIAELDIPEDASMNRPCVKPSAVPHLESALRTMGLSPKEVENVFNGTRDEGGGLDLTKLTTNLKAFLQDTTEGSGIKNRRVVFDRVSNNLEKIGLPIPVKEKQDQISIRDLIAAWERMTDTGDKEEPLPADFRGLIDRILQKASLPNENPASQSSLTSLGKFKGGLETITEKISENAAFFNGAAPTEKKALFKKASPLKSVDTTTHKNPLIHSAGKETKPVIHAPKSSWSPISGKRLESPMELNHDHGPDTGRKAESFSVQSEKTAFSIPGHTNDLGFPNTVETVKRGQTPVKHVLPAQLIDRVGRQISRSLRRGDRIIRIQLKPPELGTVKVAMDLKENVLKLGMIIENSSVKELMLANANELRDALIEQGVKLEKIDVQIGNHSNPTFGDLKEGSTGEQWGGQGGKTFLPPTEDYLTDILTEQSLTFYGDQIVDLVV